MSLLSHCAATFFAIFAWERTAASSTAYGGTLAKYGPSGVSPHASGDERPMPRVSMPIRS